jgi:hypothetical protein
MDAGAGGLVMLSAQSESRLAADPFAANAGPEASPRAGTAVTAPPNRPGVPSSWVEKYIARRDAARAFLATHWMEPKRMHRDDPSVVAAWCVPGYHGLLSDHELIALAEHYGWRAPA